MTLCPSLANGRRRPKLGARAAGAWLLGWEQEEGMVCIWSRVQEKEVIQQQLHQVCHSCFFRAEAVFSAF